VKFKLSADKAGCHASAEMTENRATRAQELAVSCERCSVRDHMLTISQAEIVNGGPHHVMDVQFVCQMKAQLPSP
jgi:hypothetical protein